MSEKQIVIQAENIKKSFTNMMVLNDISLEISSGGLTLLTGPSGSGKTTLLNILSSIEKPDSGIARVKGEDITKFSSKNREKYRARNGQVFQRSGLLSGLTAEQNITAVHNLNGNTLNEAWVDFLVTELAVSSLMKKRIGQISGGQAQRVGIVRALAHRPELIFADEPTASLDQDSKHDVHELLQKISMQGSSVVMVSHDDISQQYASTVFEITDGKISSSFATNQDL